MLALYSNRSYFVHLLLAAVVTLTLGIVSSIYGQETTYDASFASSVKEAIPINVLVGQSRVINFDRPIGRFSISNPEIAEAVMVRPDQVLVNGKAFGQVNFIAWEKADSKFIVFDVFVRANLSLIDSQMRALFPRDDIRLSQANGSVVLSGTVSDPQVVTQADSVVQAAGFKTVNMLASPVKNAVQVQLQIRVAEVSRNKLRELGSTFAYQGSPGAGGFISGGGPGTLSEVAGGIMNSTFASAMNVFLMGGNVTNMIRAMQTNGTLRALAEPNLIAMDGQTASFLAGGEFPISPRSKPALRRKSKRSWPLTVKMIAATIGTMAMSRPVVELFRRVSACPSNTHGPMISTAVYSSRIFQYGSNGLNARAFSASGRSSRVAMAVRPNATTIGSKSVTATRMKR